MAKAQGPTKNLTLARDLCQLTFGKNEQSSKLDARVEGHEDTWGREDTRVPHRGRRHRSVSRLRRG